LRKNDSLIIYDSIATYNLLEIADVKPLIRYKNMSKSYVIQQAPFVVPTTDGKLIEEHVGRVISNEPGLSIAHMVAPSGWSEPFQNPEFDEYTMLVRGRKQIEIDGETITLKVGESLLVRKGARVRYSNPFEEEAEYWSVCVPAFSPDLVNREENAES
jgi:mannose-6-phosphate isomerase-like protein (cupin superfamily)